MSALAGISLVIGGSLALMHQSEPNLIVADDREVLHVVRPTVDTMPPTTTTTTTTRPQRASRSERAPRRTPSYAQTNVEGTMARIANCEGANGYINRPHNGGSTAAGKYGYLRGTWNNFGGYATADQAPEAVQDERASQDIAAGKANQQWAASRGCWSRR